MKQLSFLPDTATFPNAADADRAQRGVEQWLEAVERASDPALSESAHDLVNDAAGKALLAALFGNSPYLTRLVVNDPAYFRDLLQRGPGDCCAMVMADIRRLTAPPADQTESAPAYPSTDEIMAALRIAKSRAALAIGLADIANIWPLERVTGALSLLAEASLSTVVTHLLREGAARGEVALRHADDPERDSGFVVLALGKLGACELNYSSDIDLMVLFDEEQITYTGSQSPQQFFVRLTRTMVKMMEERTQHGYVFRTDLRLRPDPGATPVAVSMLAAEMYYESMGQNWERAAMIKARPVAGDKEAGQGFLSRLRPFLWRKNLDFAAIQDIHSIKRQINAHRGGEKIAVAGHNVKLGRGGIREIEFFAQTQQLIWGGREPRLRTQGTCETLDALVAVGRVTADAARQLKEAYAFLRRVEHRIQMVEDRQSHTIPADPEGVRQLAVFLGYPDTAAFTTALLGHLGRVEKLYGELFEEAPSLGGPGSLVFTGTEDDPETLKTLAGMGFKDGSAISAVIRGWHHGRYRAMRSARARELLTELMPSLLTALGQTTNPDAAFMNFDEFLKRLPAGVQLLSLFHVNRGLLTLLAEIMGSAPRLATYLSANPSLLDAVLSEGFEETLPNAAALAEELDTRLRQARDFEDILEITRRFANDHKFRVGIQTLRTRIDVDAQGAALADIADTVLRRIFIEVSKDFARQNGTVQDGKMCILALGKLGARALAENSDLDLVFVYDMPDVATLSSGPKTLPVSTYYARLSQRLISALSVPTAEGKLYEVDIRLRPSGNAGPVAASLEAFRLYHAESAWTWEHMALTRARIVTGGGNLPERLEAVIRETLTRPRESSRVLADVADMRERLERSHPGDSLWDVKYLRGGLIDVEFIAQCLELRHAHAQPEVLSASTGEALAKLADTGHLPQDDARLLITAERLWRALLGMLRLTVAGTLDEDQAPPGLKMALAKAAGEENFDSLKQLMQRTAHTVFAIFNRVIADPARRMSDGAVRAPEGSAHRPVPSEEEPKP